MCLQPVERRPRLERLRATPFYKLYSSKMTPETILTNRLDVNEGIEMLNNLLGITSSSLKSTDGNDGGTVQILRKQNFGIF